jgi:hypothetical protein
VSKSPKSLQKNRQKNPKPIFSRFFLSRFWAFLGEGSSKNTIKKSQKNPDQPWYFFGLRGTNQPRRGHFCFECPLKKAKGGLRLPGRFGFRASSFLPAVIIAVVGFVRALCNAKNKIKKDARPLKKDAAPSKKYSTH